MFSVGDQEYRVVYTPGESNTAVFGGNSNWRGPIWFPINYLLIEALETYYLYHGDELKFECPTGSGQLMNLFEVARTLGRRLGSVFLPDANGRRPCHGDDRRFASDPYWKDLPMFYEYFHGDTGRGLGANHQNRMDSPGCAMLPSGLGRVHALSVSSPGRTTRFRGPASIWKTWLGSNADFDTYRHRARLRWSWRPL